MDDCSEDLGEGEEINKIIKELNRDELMTGGAEFSWNPRDGVQPEADQADENHVENVYAYEEFEPYINLDCIQVDAQGGNSTPFEILSKTMTNLTDDGLIKKKILKLGTEELPANAAVYVHYNSYLEHAEVPFDSSYLRSKKPMRIQMGVGAVYSGFELSVCSMRKGERSQFLIDHIYAFQEMGVPPRIPACATILMEIELINFVDCGNVNLTENSEMDEKTKFETIYSKAKSLHALGNDYFNNKNMAAAVDSYKKGEKLLLSCKMNSDEEEKRMTHLILKLYINMMICYNTPKLNMPEKVCICAREAFESALYEARRNPKLYYNLGKAQIKLQDFKKATRSLTRALGLAPTCKDINDALIDLEEKRKKYSQEEKMMFKRALGFNPDDTKEEEKQSPEDLPVDDDFKELIKVMAKDFIRSPKSKLALPPGLTKGEKVFCEAIASDHDMVVEAEIVGGIENLFIVK